MSAWAGYAVWLREDAKLVSEGTSRASRYECPRCGGTAVREGEDGECRECNRREGKS